LQWVITQQQLLTPDPANVRPSSEIRITANLLFSITQGIQKYKGSMPIGWFLSITPTGQPMAHVKPRKHREFLFYVRLEVAFLPTTTLLLLHFKMGDTSHFIVSNDGLEWRR
jgi:hypothetical protein